MPDVCKTDLQKVISYLDEAQKLYDALPMQTIPTSEGKDVSLLKLCRVRQGWGEAKCKCRAHMIRLLTNKLKAKLHDKK